MLFAVENPSGSLLFLCTPMQILQRSLSCCSVELDQCQYGLRPPSPAPGEFLRKATVFLGNFSELLLLEKRCPGTGPRHQHVRVLGRRPYVANGKTCSASVAMWAGRYPHHLCQELAKIVCMCLRLCGLLFAAPAADSLALPCGLTCGSR